MKKAKVIGTALAAAGTLAGGFYGLCSLIDEILFNRKMTPPEKISRKISGCDAEHLGEFLRNNLAWVETYGYERHYMISDSGHKLTGYLMKAKEPSDIYLFGAHGYRSYGKKEFCGVAQYYLSRGINVFFPDHVASGESEGTHCTFGYHEVRDSLKWLSYMKESFGENISIILHGVSMGSATVMMMGGREDLPENVKMIVADCGFTSAKALFDFKLNALGVRGAKMWIDATNLAHKRRHGYDFDALRPVDSVKNIRLPILFVHGAEDKLVPCFMAQELYEACGSEQKDIMIVEGADHAQSYMYAKDSFEAKLDSMISLI